jgi:hypothetical protein
MRSSRKIFLEGTVDEYSVLLFLIFSENYLLHKKPLILVVAFAQIPVAVWIIDFAGFLRLLMTLSVPADIAPF